VPQIIRQDTSKTTYIPEIKILKRPTNPGSTTATPPSSIAKKDTRTLQEREASYLAARRKIFGDEDESLVGRDTQPTQHRPDTNIRSESPRPVATQIRQAIGPASNGARGFGGQSARPHKRP